MTSRVRGPSSLRTHGHGTDNSPTYRSWAQMLQRCRNPKNDRFKDYGGRGIIVCDRWRSFENFLSDMGSRPEGTSIDRYPDKNGNYEPGNCRWATRREQQNNMRSNAVLACYGITATLSEWAERTGIAKDTLRRRVNMCWPVDRILAQPVQQRRKTA